MKNNDDVWSTCWKEHISESRTEKEFLKESKISGSFDLCSEQSFSTMSGLVAHFLFFLGLCRASPPLFLAGWLLCSLARVSGNLGLHGNG